MSKGIQFCSGYDYGRKCVTWDVGKYNEPEIKSTVGNDAISSIKIITPGYYARTYKDKNFGGGQMDFATDVTKLDQYSWNDKISSLEVVDGNPPVSTLPPIDAPISTPPYTPPASTNPAPAQQQPAYTPPVQQSQTQAQTQPQYDTPAGTEDEWSTTTWILLAVFILFFLLIVVGGLVYVLRGKATTAANRANPVGVTNQG